MRPGAVALCAALALAGHVLPLLLLQWTDSRQATSARGSAAAQALHVKLVAAPAPMTAAPTAPPHAQDQPANTDNAPSAASDAMPIRAMQPTFDGDPPEVPMPDALLPDTGVVQVRAFFNVDADGRSTALLTTQRPASAAPAFTEFGQFALAQARFTATHTGHPYCLQLDFRAGATAASWSWRPDTSAERCLNGTRDSARPLR